MPEPCCAVTTVAYAVSVAPVAYPTAVPVVAVAIISIPDMPPIADVGCSISVAVSNSRRVGIAVNRLFVVAVGICVAATIAIAAAAIGPVVRSGDRCTDERAGGKP
jgi:hypothetical protein